MNYGYNYDYSNAVVGATAFSALAGVWLVMIIIFSIIALAVGIVCIISMWKLFVKAGRTGWYAIIPILNIITMLDIVGYKWYYICAFCLSAIPYIGWLAALLFNVTYMIKFVRAYGNKEPIPFAIGLIFLPYIFLPIMAFSKKIEYTGQVVKGDIDFNDLF
ncbi:MAG TPA: DUF5684 domain-containing protein [Bacilli bacterium]|nr:DUF5684 domain-containing protein [Bacilli bacterium]